MPIKCLTPRAEIELSIIEKVERQKTALVYNLCAIGEQVLTAARNTNSYKDQTGNLRSSIGYAVIVDGEVIQASSFNVVKDGNDGAKNGKEYLEELIQVFSTGIALVVVAGMEYAAYVSAKGRDVLDSSELLAEKLVPAMLEQFGIK